MAFAQNPVNYAAQYMRELANAYPYMSHFADVYAGENANKYRILNGKAVQIPSLFVSGAKAANRNSIDGVFNRNWNNSWQNVELGMDREWDTLIDPLDIIETNEVATIANITKTFNELQKIPEMDARAASQIAGAAGAFGGQDGTTLTAANILAQWDAYIAYMTDQRVNRDRVQCKMTPAVYKLLKEASGLSRFVETSEGFRGVDRNIARLDGVRIEEVPADLMKSAYDFTEGFTPAAGASQINLLLYDPLAVAGPISYDTSMITPPTAASKGKYLYYEHYYYDVFALQQRNAGLFVNMAAPSLGTLVVTSKAGTEASGDTIINVSGNKLLFVEGTELVVTSGQNAAVSCTYGAVPDAGETWVQKYTGEFLLTSQTSSKYVTVALVNKETGFVIAAGNAVIVAKA